MKSYAKAKVWLLTLTVALLADRSEMYVHHIDIVDCGPNTWRLYDAITDWTGHGLRIEANMAYGTNSSVVHTISIGVPFCPDFFPCRLNISMPDFARMFCNQSLLNPIANESCRLMEAFMSMYEHGFPIPYCQDVMSCMKENTYVRVNNVLCSSTDIDPHTNGTCEAGQAIANSDRVIQEVMQRDNITDSPLCWTYRLLYADFDVDDDGSDSNSEDMSSDSADST